MTGARYEDMLKELYTVLPSRSLAKERFQVPRAESFMQGKKTMLTNFSAMAKTARREEGHLYKFLVKQSGSSATVEESRLVFNGKFSAEEIQRWVEEYFSRFVLCPECRRPDTQFVEQRGVKNLKCSACGAHSPVKE